MNPHAVTRQFEDALCEYTGAPYAVAVSSCTMALLLACRWQVRKDESKPDRSSVDILIGSTFEIPRRTYVSVPQSIIHAGGRVAFRDKHWTGYYQLKPYPIFDSARWFSSDMYNAVRRYPKGVDGERQVASTFGPGAMVCCSFHVAKILGDSQGGCILLDDSEADAWLRRARFDGRTEGVAPKDDKFDMIGYHCYMSPDVAARLLNRLSFLPKHNEPLPNDDYPDLSTMEIFK